MGKDKPPEQDTDPQRPNSSEQSSSADSGSPADPKSSETTVTESKSAESLSQQQRGKTNMTSKDPATVVDLQRRQEQTAKSQDRLGDILKKCRGTAQKHLNALLGNLFENVDDALFELAERAGSTRAQQMFFEGMREVRKQRQFLERGFQEHIRTSFSDFAAGRVPEVNAMPGTDAGSADSSSGDLKLSLVEDHDLEQSLALSSMIGKVENRLTRPLYALNQRLSVLIGGAKLESASNPVGPAQLADAFGRSVATLEASVEVRLIVLKLFERYVLSKLDLLYEELNTLLVEAGVLPQLKQLVGQPSGQRAARRPGPSGTSSTASESGYSAAAGQTRDYDDYSGEGDQTSIEVQNEILNTLHALLAQRRPSGGMSGYGGPAPAPGSMLRTEDLLGALGALQSQFSAVDQGAASGQGGAVMPTIPALSPDQLKQLLLKHASQNDETGKRDHVKRDDEDTIELVSMLFEYIAKDRNIPAIIQAQLGRLQIPYLKVALLDRHLFAQKAHPARRLLDELAQLSVGWTEEADRDGRVLNKIRGVVESVLNDFQSDIEVLKSLHEDLQQFAQGLRKRAEIAEQRAAETTRGKEKLLAARRASGAAIEERLHNSSVPAIISGILTRPWANVLVLLHLRKGEDSSEYRSALKFVDDLIWSSQPKSREEDRARLRTMLPDLGKALRKGLSLVAYQESDIKQVLADLTAFYRALIESARAPDAPTSSAVAAPLRSVDPLAENDAESRGEAETTAHDSGFEIVGRADASAIKPTPTPAHLDLPAVDAFRTEIEEEKEAKTQDDFLALAKSLTVGAWLEFTDKDGNSERAKLSWISPISSKYLFVNRRGLKVADKSVYELAADLREGRAETLESVPLFDRAMDAIVQRLKAQPEDEGSGSADAAHKPSNGDATASSDGAEPAAS